MIEKIIKYALGEHDPESAQDWRTSSDLWSPDEELHNIESGHMEVSHMIEIFYGLASQELGMDPVGPWTFSFGKSHMALS